MPVELRKHPEIDLWIISDSLNRYCIFDENEMKSLVKQCKEAGF